MDTDDPFARFGMGGAGGMGGGFPRSFSSGMGGLGNHGRMVRKQQDPPVVYDLQVTLEEVLAGCTKKMKISRKRLNPDGRTTRKEDKILEVQIKKGWKEGTKITFPKEGDEMPTNIPADVVFVLKDKPHAVFRRDGSDIIYPAKISLRDVSCWFFLSSFLTGCDQYCLWEVASSFPILDFVVLTVSTLILYRFFSFHLQCKSLCVFAL